MSIQLERFMDTIKQLDESIGPVYHIKANYTHNGSNHSTVFVHGPGGELSHNGKPVGASHDAPFKHPKVDEIIRTHLEKMHGLNTGPVTNLSLKRKASGEKQVSRDYRYPQDGAPNRGIKEDITYISEDNNKNPYPLYKSYTVNESGGNTLEDNATAKGYHGSKKHMHDIVSRFNSATDDEHEHYLNRTLDGKKSKAHRDAENSLASLNREFKKHFGHLIPAEDKKGFNLRHYDTYDVKKFVKVWHES